MWEKRDQFQTDNLHSILRNVRDMSTNIRKEKPSASTKNVILLACLQECYFLLQST